VSYTARYLRKKLESESSSGRTKVKARGNLELRI